MAAWQAGIVVVASAGNGGPGADDRRGAGQRALRDHRRGDVRRGHAADRFDDFLTSFSAAGPTVEGFVKPELVAPGGHLLAHVDPHSYLAQHHAEWLATTTRHDVLLHVGHLAGGGGGLGRRRP